MSLTKQFHTNPEIENAGVEIKYAPNEDKSVPTFVIARAGKSNKRYQVALNAALKPHARAQQLGTLAPEMAEEIYMGVFIGTILKGWSNVLMSDVTGNKADKGYADFNAENAKALFARLPEIYDDLVDKSNSASLFREETNEEDAKN